jgi:MFS family permease
MMKTQRRLLTCLGTLVMGSIITSDLVPIEIRGTYQSYINIIYGLGSALGAATGGAIADSLGWRWEFGFQVPFLSACLLLGFFTIPKTLGLKEGVEHDTLAQAMKKFDYKGSLLLTMSITTLILGLVSFSFY